MIIYSGVSYMNCIFKCVLYRLYISDMNYIPKRVVYDKYNWVICFAGINNLT